MARRIHWRGLDALLQRRHARAVSLDKLQRCPFRGGLDTLDEQVVQVIDGVLVGWEGQVIHVHLPLLHRGLELSLPPVQPGHVVEVLHLSGGRVLHVEHVLAKYGPFDGVELLERIDVVLREAIVGLLVDSQSHGVVGHLGGRDQGWVQRFDLLLPTEDLMDGEDMLVVYRAVVLGAHGNETLRAQMVEEAQGLDDGVGVLGESHVHVDNIAGDPKVAGEAEVNGLVDVVLNRPWLWASDKAAPYSGCRIHDGRRLL